MSSHHYITDITTGSTSAQLINEDFGKHASDLTIFSFYETLQMKLGITSSMIVEKSSAILGRVFCLCSLGLECFKEKLMVLGLKESVFDEKGFNTSTLIIETFASLMVPMMKTM